MSKTLKTRIQNKTDTSENWAKATSFVPLAGEAIIYSDVNKIKIGDGSTAVTELPFVVTNGNSSQFLKGDGSLDTTSYAPLTGATFTGSIITSGVMSIKAGLAYLSQGTRPIAGRSALCGNGLIMANPATQNDQGWIRVTGTDESDTCLEIATGDDGSTDFNIHFRGYNISNEVTNDIVLPKDSGTVALTKNLPTKVSELTNDSGYTTNTGTVTSVAVKMNGETKGTVTSSGTIDLGTVITTHQDISGKANTSDVLLTNNASTWTWGSLTSANGYKLLGSSNEPEGGSIAFAAKKGQTFMQIDGRYYDQEGQYQLIDSNDLTTTLSSYVLTSDSRLSDSRKASDVYDWAKKATLSDAINTLSAGTATPTDNDYYVCQYAGGGTSTISYHRRPVSSLWAYIKSKLAAVATSGSYTDLTNKPTIPTVNNGTLTMQVEGNTKTTFTANQSGAVTFNVTTSDLGLSQALKFIGKFDTLPSTSDYAVGNVVLIGSKEYVLLNNDGTKTWDEMGDESSHALNTISITGTGILSGGGNLQENRTITHNTVSRTNATSSSAPGFGSTFTVIDSITSDSYGHITAVNTKTVTIPSTVATTSAAGLMSTADKTTLANKVNKNGDTFSFGAIFSFANSGNWPNNTDVTFPYNCGGFTWTDQSDGIYLYGEASSNDNLNLVIQLTDDNSNKVSFRNASNVETASITANGYIYGAIVYSGGAQVVTVGSSTSSVKTGITATSSQPSFTGTAHKHTFTGSSHLHSVTTAAHNHAVTDNGHSHKYDKVTSAGFSGSAVTSSGPSATTGSFGTTSATSGKSTTGISAALKTAPTVSAVGTHTHTVTIPAPSFSVNYDSTTYNLSFSFSAGSTTATTSSVSATTQTCSKPDIVVTDNGHTHSYDKISSVTMPSHTHSVTASGSVSLTYNNGGDQVTTIGDDKIAYTTSSGTGISIQNTQVTGTAAAVVATGTISETTASGTVGTPTITINDNGHTHTL